ncbi:hypothetical protein LGQ02_11295 [Bacillus shivajii]|uniref:hypothetical protein n=1 Tax=Bacillus shivajii TaxID=1983719 RepID=UPI001CFB4FEA|nr:hypothetical protein [Bacillus shivajii]UCZ51462.1 hypothetical protein LGQ02_11295 [Bacillus shivajii]
MSYEHLLNEFNYGIWDIALTIITHHNFYLTAIIVVVVIIFISLSTDKFVKTFIKSCVLIFSFSTISVFPPIYSLTETHYNHELEQTVLSDYLQGVDREKGEIFNFSFDKNDVHIPPYMETYIHETEVYNIEIDIVNGKLTTQKDVGRIYIEEGISEPYISYVYIKDDLSNTITEGKYDMIIHVPTSYNLAERKR